MKRIAINTGGGDAPGLNAVIRAVTLSAIGRGWEVLGIREGYRGLLDSEPGLLIPLDREAVRGIGHLGGTILGTTNRGDPFNFPVKEGDRLVPRDESARLVARFRELELDALVALGGDGSMALATRLLACGLPRVIGVPKTIDNDLRGTEITFGFETAVATATDALDKLHTTAQAHRRVMVVELMGRHAGWITLHAGLGGGADVVLLPEIPYDMDRVCEKIRARYSSGRRFAIVVVAEGATQRGGEVLFKAAKNQFKEHGQLGGIADRVASEIAERTGQETRSLVLGHLQRGGSPVTFDRVLAQRLGCAATRYLAERTDSGLVAMVGGRTQLVPFSVVVGGTRGVELDDELVQTARGLGICFGDEAPGTFG
ncbi:MAG TPA: ATP-dependent 6-phosphofructokinase [Polyangiaceae bacterium]|jgi:6-phosphofructokinase 1|nr:ATP-dependent 6-phosphofructokinase [Polyangiaceae bacterium]